MASLTDMPETPTPDFNPPKTLLPLSFLSIESLFHPSRHSGKTLELILQSFLHPLYPNKSLFYLSFKYFQNPDTPHQLYHYHPGPSGTVSCFTYYNCLALLSLLPFLFPLQSILIPASERSFIPNYVTSLSKALQ